MKRILTMFLMVLLVFSTSACNRASKETTKTPITINLPSDNSINGYRKDDNTNSEKITTDKITVVEDSNSYTYWGNKNSKKFHKASCSSFKSTKDSNKVYYKTRSEFVSKNFTPCKTCNP